MGIYKPLNYDATMLIRLTTEMKDAFAGCKARGVVPSEEARRLIVAQVLEQWGVDPNPKKTSLWSVVKTRWRCFQLCQLMK